VKLDDATADRLRELGATDDMLTWLEQPEAVRELMRLSPQTGYRCESCAAYDDFAHERKCAVAAAWRALDDPRGAADIERAWDEAAAPRWPTRNTRLRRNTQTWDLSPENGFTYTSNRNAFFGDHVASVPQQTLVGRVARVSDLVRDGHLRAVDMQRLLGDPKK